MYPHLAHIFIDGAYLRELAKEHPGQLINPRHLAKLLIKSGPVQTWAYDPTSANNAFLGRVMYYDALPDPSNPQPELEAYWKAIELLDDVHLGFGALRGLSKRPRQKGVDTLLAVDMVAGAFLSLFDIAILVAGDADFVPVVEEVKRRAVMVVIAASPSSLSEDLRRAADRFIEIPKNDQWREPMRVDGKTWAT
jgi:uncharacterized LabA/DUF88 family protein